MVVISDKMAAPSGKMATRSSKMAAKTLWTFVFLAILQGLTSSAAPVSSSRTLSANPGILTTNPKQPESSLEQPNQKPSSDSLVRSISSPLNPSQRFPDSHTSDRTQHLPKTRIGLPGDPRNPIVRSGPNLSNGYTYVPLRRSFQSSSYVHDHVPRTIFKRAGAAPPLFAPGTATVTERYNDRAKYYFDAFDENEELTKTQERTRIFYKGNPDIVPVFRNLEKERKALEKQRRRFVHFKTQRANIAYKKQSGN